MEKAFRSRLKLYILDCLIKCDKFDAILFLKARRIGLDLKSLRHLNKFDQDLVFKML